jgi:serine/threonine-protein kinase
MSTPSTAADRNLIFGLVALQMDFVSREQLLDAMHAWMIRKSTPLAQVLRERGVLNDRRAALLDELVEEHISKHGDAQASLAAIRVEPIMRQQLHHLDDADVQASLASLPNANVTTDPLATSASTFVPTGLRYRRLREHARGGLGEVFVALDEDLKREVALKEIQDCYADQPEARARFLREGEITGKLEHPGVVPVYGLGTYPDGRPYYAMRFIRGESMQEAIRRFHQADEQPQRDPGERSLALRELLGRFVAVCNAVAYAHTCGVIHRDLKPANVMLGEYGETIVVDWGLARVLDQPSSEQTTAERPVLLGLGSTTEPTEMGRVVGTPAYMPPEQADGRTDRLGPHSDVFALGATLYALLTGQPPYAGADVLALAYRGDVVPARQRKRSVPAALEAVCARAMARRRQDRYPTARALAQEVQRFLADEPVEAYREPLGDKLRRWSRRNRTVVAGGVILLLCGVVGLSLGLWAVSREQARTAAALEQAEKNLELAEANLALARQAVDECFNVAREHPLFRSPRMEKVRKLLLEKTLPFYKNFRSQKPDDLDLKRQQAEQLFRVGIIEHTLGRPREALDAYREAGIVYAELADAHPAETRYRQNVGRALNNQGDMLDRLGERARAIEEHHKALAIREKLVQAHPEVAEHWFDLLATYINLGSMETASKIVQACRKARDLGMKLVKEHPHESRYRSSLATAHNNLALALEARRQHQEALDEYQASADLHARLMKDHPDEPEHAGDLVRTLSNQGLLLAAMQKPEEALREYRRAAEVGKKLIADHPDVPVYRHYLSRALNNLGLLLTDQNRAEEALVEHRQALALRAALVREHPEVPVYWNDLAGSHNNMGNALNALGRSPEAVGEYRQALVIRMKLARSQPVGHEQHHLAGTHFNLGVVLADLGKSDQALREYEQVRAIEARLVKAHPEEPAYRRRLARACLLRGELLSRQEQFGAALTDIQEALAQLAQLHRLSPREPQYDALHRMGLRERAVVRVRLGHHREADADWDRLLQLTPRTGHAFLLLRRADSRARAGDYRRSAAEVAELSRTAAPGPVLYNLACIDALNAASAARDVLRPLPERDKRAQQYARQAVALLERAAAAGHFRTAATVAGMDRDNDLAFLRDRDDYRRFRGSLKSVGGDER